MLLTDKKDNEKSFFVDYREPSRVIIKNKYLLPRIDDFND